MIEIKRKDFSNGTVYALKTDDGFLIETTDTFLPSYTKDAIGPKQNKLRDSEVGNRKERVDLCAACSNRIYGKAVQELYRIKKED